MLWALPVSGISIIVMSLPGTTSMGLEACQHQCEWTFRIFNSCVEFLTQRIKALLLAFSEYRGQLPLR